MADIDPVILQLRAELNQYKAELRNTTSLATQALGRQEKAVERLEAQFRSSSGAIAGQLKGLAAAFAGGFSVQQVAGLIDGFTRLQNSLRVAGLEGDALANVQSRLLDLSGRYGVGINELAGLFGNSSQAVREFGGSQAEILRLTEATSQALLITGTSAAQASGAILGLSQALASGKVQAEEFNQINEGGLRPLLQAAAAGERFGGSVAKLRAAVLDGAVTSQEFFRLILAGSQQLDSQASRATLTLSGAFEALTSRLTVFVGQAATSNGAAAALANGIKALADNLDTVATALAVIAAVLVGRFAAGMVAASASSGAAATALFAVQARAVGAATSLEAMAFAGAAAGRSLLAAFGGPVGIAITALTLGIALAVTRTTELERATQVNSAAQARAQNITTKAAEAVERLATAHGKARKEAIEAANAELRNVRAKLASAQASATLATAEALRARAASDASRFQAGGDALEGGLPFGLQRRTDRRAQQAEANAQKANAEFFALLGRVSELESDIAAAGRGAGRAASAGEGRQGRARSASGASAAEISARFASDLRQLRADQLQDELAITRDAERRAEISRQLDDIEYEERLAQIEASRDFTKAQKSRLRAELDRQFGRGRATDGAIVVEPTARSRARALDIEEQRNRQAEEMLRLEADVLRAEADLAPTRQARLEAERRILEIDQEIERARLEEAIAQGQIADAAAARAALQRKQSAEGEGLGRRFESPGQAYRRRLQEDAQNVNDAVEQIGVRGLESLNDGLTEAIMGVRSLGDVFKNVANQIIADLLRIAVQRAIIAPIADALFPGGGGGGGGLAGLGRILSPGGGFGGGRASGGYVAAGKLYRVNEGASPGRVEGFRPTGSGEIIPLGRMNAERRPSQVVVQQQVTVDARNSVNPEGFERRILSLAGQQAQEAAGAAYRQSMRDAPVAVQKAQRYGTR